MLAGFEKLKITIVNFSHSLVIQKLLESQSSTKHEYLVVIISPIVGCMCKN